MIQAAVADVVGPAVAADDPDRSADEVVGQGLEAAGLRPFDGAQRRAQDRDAGALLGDPGFGALVGGRAVPRPGGPIRPFSSRTNFWAALTRWSTASRMPRPNSALSSKSELAQVGPRPSRLVQ